VAGHRCSGALNLHEERVMRLDYVVKRVAIFLVIIWIAGTVNFFLPRLSGQDPIRQQLMAQAALGGNAQAGLKDMIKEYDTKFGLDKPLWEQYVTYMTSALHFDFSTSISHYPQKVIDVIKPGLPWTIALLTMTTLISWLVGTLLGAFLAWPSTPNWVKFAMPPLLTLSAVPYFLFGLILIYLLGFRLKLFPLSGGYDQGLIPNLSLSFLLNVAGHTVLPALSIVLVSLGGWALGMRGMMVTTQGEDYLIFADAKGLKGESIFLRYAIRNALLPQMTALALALGNVVAGAVLVEVIFQYPGIGSLLYQAIRASDFFLVQGIIFMVIVAIGLATLIIDLIYPILDPRITYRRS
jgi:peptide/nickel transport system permease protein